MSQNKRRRSLSESEHDDAQKLVKPVRHPDLWMDDGSIVIQAENSQFRIHRTTLSRHSPVFRDMFSIPQPTDSDDTVDGCPIVRLSDSAEDVAHLLAALYDHKLYSNRRKALAFPAIAALVRLGSKYEFEDLREEALFRLRAAFPTTLEVWDATAHDYTIPPRPSLLIDIVNLALEQGIMSILPSAYFLCIESGEDIEKIFEGWTRKDGSKAVLRPEAQKTCIVGRQKILEKLGDATLSWLHVAPQAGCNNPNQCAMARQWLALSTYKPFLAPSLGLKTWAEVQTGRLCKTCCNFARGKHDEGRSKMWDMLPESFGFPPWDELRKLDGRQN